MKDATTKNIMFVLLMFVLVFAGLKSYDNRNIEKEQDNLAMQSVTVSDLLFVYKIATGDCIEPDSFFKNIHTTFGDIVSTTSAKNVRSFGSNKIYENYCSKCHQNGVMNAPTILPNKPIDTLVVSVVNGKGQMPPYGLCDTCNSQQIKSTILWMIKNKNLEK